MMRIPFVLFVLIVARDASADLLPTGHKSVQHRLVFVDSPALQNQRLIATPIRGFGGIAEIRVGEPFPFSTKYGTKIYAVPDDFDPLKKLDYPLDFVSSDPPVDDITSISILRSTSEIETRCKLVSVSDSILLIEVVGETRFDELGLVTKGGFSIIGKLALSLAGLCGCITLRFIYKRKQRLHHAVSAENKQCSFAEEANPIASDVE